uniref:Uncharacterized protein n=1 Tax=Acrobeloides nanus TaxID=290746 RepID=A0A914DT29_9BILA
MDDQHVLLVISGLSSYLKDPPKTCEDLFCIVGSCEDLGDEVFSSFNKSILSYQLCPGDYLKRIKNGTWVSNESKTCILLDVDNLIT